MESQRVLHDLMTKQRRAKMIKYYHYFLCRFLLYSLNLTQVLNLKMVINEVSLLYRQAVIIPRDLINPCLFHSSLLTQDKYHY